MLFVTQVTFNNTEITEYPLTNNCRFIVIASDGVWEFLDNNKVVELVTPYYKINDVNGAINKIINVSTEFWMKVNINNIGR